MCQWTPFIMSKIFGVIFLSIVFFNFSFGLIPDPSTTNSSSSCAPGQTSADLTAQCDPEKPVSETDSEIASNTGSDSESKTDSEIGSKTSFQAISNYILSALNSSTAFAHPCEDFYQFVCGAGNQNDYRNLEFVDHRFTAAATKTDVTDVLKRSLQSVELSDENVPKVLKNVRLLYEQCRAWDIHNYSNVARLMTFIKGYATWPLWKLTNGEPWNSDHVTWFEVAGRLKADFEVPAFLDIEASDEHPSQSGVQGFESTSATAPKRYSYILSELPLKHSTAFDVVLFPHLRHSHEQRILAAFQKLNLFDDTLFWKVYQLKSIVADVVDFEINLLTATVGAAKRRLRKEGQGQTESIRFLALDELSDFLNVSNNYWSTFVVAALKRHPRALMGVLSGQIGVRHLEYVRRITRRILETSPEVIANYLLWKLLEFLQPFFVETGQLENDACLENAIEAYHYSVPLLREHIKTTTTSGATKPFMVSDERDRITNYVRNAVEEMLHENEWLTAQAKDTLIERLRVMKVDQGFPKWTTNASTVDRHYAKRKLSRDKTFLENYLMVSHWSAAPLPKTAAWENLLFLDPSFPDFYKFSVVGTAMSENLFSQVKTAAETLFQQQLLETPSLTDIYRNRSTCLVQDYNDYCYVFSVPHNEWGKVDGDENAPQPETKTLCIEGRRAPLSGGQKAAALHAARLAFSNGRNIADMTEFTAAKGVEFSSPQQLFFIGYALARCQSLSKRLAPAVAADLLQGSLPREAEINLLLTNFPAFSEAFGCQPENRMRKTRDICRVF